MLNKSKGFTVIELMISLVIGLVVIGAVLYIFLSNSQTFRVTEAQSKIQDSGRFTLEILSREIRHTGYNPFKEFCGGGGPTGFQISDDITDEIQTNQLRFTTGWDINDSTESAIMSSIMDVFAIEEDNSPEAVVFDSSDDEVSDVTISGSSNVLRLTSLSNTHNIKQLSIESHDKSNNYFSLDSVESVINLQSNLKEKKAIIDNLESKDNKTPQELDELNRRKKLENTLIALEQDCIRGTLFKTNLDLTNQPSNSNVTFSVPNNPNGMGYNYEKGNILVAQDLVDFSENQNSFVYYFIDQEANEEIPSLYKQVNDQAPVALVRGVKEFELDEINHSDNTAISLNLIFVSEMSGFAESLADDGRLEQPFRTSTVVRN